MGAFVAEFVTVHRQSVAAYDLKSAAAAAAALAKTHGWKLMSVETEAEYLSRRAQEKR